MLLLLLTILFYPDSSLYSANLDVIFADGTFIETDKNIIWLKNCVHEPENIRKSATFFPFLLPTALESLQSSKQKKRKLTFWWKKLFFLFRFQQKLSTLLKNNFLTWKAFHRLRNARTKNNFNKKTFLFVMSTCRRGKRKLEKFFWRHGWLNHFCFVKLHVRMSKFWKKFPSLLS